MASWPWTHQFVLFSIITFCSYIWNRERLHIEEHPSFKLVLLLSLCPPIHLSLIFLLFSCLLFLHHFSFCPTFSLSFSFLTVFHIRSSFAILLPRMELQSYLGFPPQTQVVINPNANFVGHVFPHVATRGCVHNICVCGLFSFLKNFFKLQKDSQDGSILLSKKRAGERNWSFHPPNTEEGIDLQGRWI